jgi:hypothetical protein
MTTISHPYDLPSEECVMLVCSYIESLLVAAQTIVPPISPLTPTRLLSTNPPLPQPPSLPTPPEETSKHPHSHSPKQPLTPPRRRSLDYVAERPNGVIHHVLGKEVSIGVGYDEVDIQRQRERIALRFSSKSVPKISILEYLDRYRSPPLSCVGFC